MAFTFSLNDLSGHINHKKCQCSDVSIFVNCHHVNNFFLHAKLVNHVCLFDTSSTDFFLIRGMVLERCDGVKILKG